MGAYVSGVVGAMFGQRRKEGWVKEGRNGRYGAVGRAPTASTVGL